MTRRRAIARYANKRSAAKATSSLRMDLRGSSNEDPRRYVDLRARPPSGRFGMRSPRTTHAFFFSLYFFLPRRLPIPFADYGLAEKRAGTT